ncbi:hypothetical protein LPJ66_006403 [Kickxella alabastrina]|uniref:Uncharacterized protein n=1 Tax=Kickxella alabastrina TaxID=61397 RepID=A0ACC1ID91_9FUNG|nr:hypothetical protein LPJ66_006403 [Kickxella alabastrina]
MANDSYLGANPSTSHRKRMQDRDSKRNKDVRKKMRETVILHKDTSNMERKIEQYKDILSTRKMTASEKEKLQRMEDELKEVKDKQREAGIEPREQNTSDVIAGYDPMAESEATGTVIGGQYKSSSDDSDDEDLDHNKGAQLDDLGIPTIAVVKPTATKGSVPLLPMPPMPPGTPPPLEKNVSSGSVWPPLPSGPSPMYLNNPQKSAYRRPPPFTNQNQQQQQQRQRPPFQRGSDPRSSSYRPRPPHPYDPQGAIRPNIPPVPPFIHARTNMPPPPPLHLIRPLRPARPHSATVLAAEPQVRDLKKELTTLVPAAIARKSKQNDRQRVLAAVPMAPVMVVNAAPEIDAGTGNSSTNAQRPAVATSSSLLGTIRPLAGVQFSTASSQRREQQAVPENLANSQPPTTVARGSGSSIDDEYQKFLQQMNNIL